MSQAIQRCGFASRLRETGKTFTVLAPSDEAFLKIPPARLEKMMNDRASCVGEFIIEGSKQNKNYTICLLIYFQHFWRIMSFPMLCAPQ